MLEIRGNARRGVDGISRRGFLKAGTLSFGGLTLPQVLALRDAQAASARRDTAVILFWQAGGPSHIDTVDMKPDQPIEGRGPFQPIATSQPGFDVCELMPGHARIADKLAIVRSLHHNLSVHDDGSHWMQTGYPLLNARAQGQSHPAQGAVVAKVRGANDRELPPYVCIPEAYSSPKGFYQSAAYLGPRFNALNAGGDPTLGNYRLPDLTLPADVTMPRLEHRRELLRVFDSTVRTAEASTAVRNLDVSQTKAFDLLTGAKARAAFDLSQETVELREKYGRHAYGHGALLARRLVEAGVTFVTINLYEADVDWWDDHYTIEKNLRKRLPMFDQAFATLVDDLHQRGLADRVLVAAFGEFGRSPFISSKDTGRGHWPGAFSAVLSGGGIRGGQIVGSTTSNGGAPRDRPLTPGDLLATIYHQLGIDHELMLPDKLNRPVRLVAEGEPIAEIV